MRTYSTSDFEKGKVIQVGIVNMIGFYNHLHHLLLNRKITNNLWFLSDFGYECLDDFIIDSIPALFDDIVLNKSCDGYVSFYEKLNLMGVSNKDIDTLLDGFLIQSNDILNQVSYEDKNKFFAFINTDSEDGFMPIMMINYINTT